MCVCYVVCMVCVMCVLAGGMFYVSCLCGIWWNGLWCGGI